MTGTTEYRSIYSGPVRRALERLERDISNISTEGLPEGGDPGDVLTIGLDGEPFWAPPSGGGGSGSYVHHQGTPAAVWTITHGLPFRPNVTVVDSGGSQVEGDLSYSGTDVIVSFSAAFAGTAYLS